MDLRYRLGFLPLCLLMVLLLALPAWAAGFKVLEARTQEVAGVYRLDARIDYELSDPALEALFNGVPLTLQLEMEILRRRDWLWDETVASLTQRFRLEYHALARQYLVTNLNSGEFRSFPTRSAAMEYLGRIEDFPLIDSSLLEPDGNYYYGQLRASLDIESLPAPLRPVAYLSSQWRLASPWYLWSL
ncbi:MAG: DUF4390 domain-containing protein [Candidatus Competibacteraceae bacterium]|nr:DUF4390 domain-containing protein [Candidatus Competibacteraceae bacterium]